MNLVKLRSRNIRTNCRSCRFTVSTAMAKYREETRTAVVVGAGPAGSLAALHLARLGWKVQVYEGRVKPTSESAAKLRSYAIALGSPGLGAITQVAEGPDMQRFAYRGIVAVQGGRKVVVPTLTTKALMSRTDIAEHLIQQAEKHHADAISFTFNAPCTAVDLAARRVRFGDGSGAGGEVEVGYDLLVGADGHRSVVRQAMIAADPSMSIKVYDSPSARLSYKTFHDLPEAHAPPVIQEQQAERPGRYLYMLRSSPEGLAAGGGSTLMCGPNSRGSGYDGLVVTKRGHYERLHTAEQYEAMLRATLPTLGEHWLHSMAQQMMDSPVSHFGTGQRVSSFVGDCVALVGDAAHPLTPATGQGATAALGDPPALAKALQNHPDSLQRALAEYDATRRPLLHDLLLLDNLFGWNENGSNLKAELPLSTLLWMHWCQLQVGCYRFAVRLAHKLLPRRVPALAAMRPIDAWGSYSASLRWIRLSTAAVMLAGTAVLGGLMLPTARVLGGLLPVVTAG